MALYSVLRSQVLDPLSEHPALLMICVATGITMLGQGVIAPVLPLYAKDFGVSTALVGATISVFGFARILFNLPSGMLSDRLGRRVFLIGGPVVIAIGTFLSAIAADIWQLLAYRFIAGIGSAMFMTAGLTVVADISTPENRGRNLSLHLGSLLVGVSIGPAVGGITAELFNLRAPFYLVGALSLLCSVWAWRVVPETVQRRSEAVAEEQHDGLPTPPSPSKLRPVLANMPLVLVSLVTFSIFFSRTGARQTILPLFGNEEFGLSAGALGGIFAMMALINLATIVPAGAAADQFGRKRTIVPAGMVAVAGLCLFAITDTVAMFLVAAVLLAFGTGIAGPAPAAYAADVIPDESRGLGMGLFRTYSDVGFVVGPLLLGWIGDATGSFRWPLVFTAALMAACVFAFALFARETAGVEDREPAAANV